MSEEEKVDFRQVRMAVRGRKIKERPVRDESGIEIPEKPLGVNSGYHEWDCPQCLGKLTLKLENVEKVQKRRTGSFCCSKCGCEVRTFEKAVWKDKSPHLQMPRPERLTIQEINLRDLADNYDDWGESHAIDFVGRTLGQVNSCEICWQFSSRIRAVYVHMYGSMVEPSEYYIIRSPDRGDTLEITSTSRRVYDNGATRLKNIGQFLNL